MAKKRAPGGGRKRLPAEAGKRSHFATRITMEMRHQLEAEADYSGKSIAQVAERWLQIGSEETRQREAEDPIQALSYLLNSIEDQTRYLNDDDKYCTWRNDVFAFEAFRAATNMLLDQLRPGGELRQPKAIDGVPTERTVTQHAEFAFYGVWRRLQNSSPQSPTEVEAALRKAHPNRGTPYPDRNLGMLSRASYNDDRARRALDIRPKTEAATGKRNSKNGDQQ